ncbi:hypothetical protein AVEN_77199-1 [Araneus ventricosus]|uniref:Uncharacterized protein n=1 Tax=Araneus ventricosus TaxID=182803 RepID=A0A4Y2LM92_ARAVE|nr:hypothetical protein AVEN_77199-1 [Araneus ventricosus]
MVLSAEFGSVPNLGPNPSKGRLSVVRYATHTISRVIPKEFSDAIRALPKSYLAKDWLPISMGSEDTRSSVESRAETRLPIFTDLENRVPNPNQPPNPIESLFFLQTPNPFVEPL